MTFVGIWRYSIGFCRDKTWWIVISSGLTALIISGPVTFRSCSPHFTAKWWLPQLLPNFDYGCQTMPTEAKKKVSRKCQQNRPDIWFTRKVSSNIVNGIAMLHVYVGDQEQVSESSLTSVQDTVSERAIHFLWFAFPFWISRIFVGIMFSCSKNIFVVTSYFQVQPISVAKVCLSMFTQPIKSQKDIHVTMSPVQAEFPTAASGQTIKLSVVHKRKRISPYMLETADKFWAEGCCNSLETIEHHLKYIYSENGILNFDLHIAIRGNLPVDCISLPFDPSPDERSLQGSNAHLLKG